MQEVLRALTGTMGIPGREKPVMDIIEKELEAFDCRRDALGNLIVTVHAAQQGQKTILLEAHADRIGLMVTGFVDGGFVRVTSAGGIDRHTVMGSELEIEGIEGPVTGIVAAPFPYPAKPHNSAPAADYTIPEVDALYVDTGLADPKKHIRIGAPAVIRQEQNSLLGERVAAPGLDNRICCLALIEAARRLKKEKLRAGVTLLFATREEVRGQGAPSGAFSVLPDEAIVLDTAFGKSPDTKEEDSSELGGGPEIAFAGTLDADFVERIIKVAETEKIPYQTIAFGRTTGTDADALSTTASGIPTALVSIPIRFMHHPVETADMSDVRATVDLITAYVRGL